MRGRTSILAAAIPLSLLCPQAVEAVGLKYDLRFSDGTKTRHAVVGSYTLELWARVTGSDFDLTNEGIASSYLVVQSEQVQGNLFSGAIASGNTMAPFNLWARNGGPNSITADSVGDWGGTSANITDTNYMLVNSEAGGGGTYAGGSVGQAVDANTWEFHLATYTLQINSVHPLSSADETRIVVAKPIATYTGTVIVAAPYATYRQDGVSHTVWANQPATYEGVYGDGVSFIVPEPGAGLLALAGALTLLSRRRVTSARASPASSGRKETPA